MRAILFARALRFERSSVVIGVDLCAPFYPIRTTRIIQISENERSRAVSSIRMQSLKSSKIQPSFLDSFLVCVVDNSRKMRIFLTSTDGTL